MCARCVQDVCKVCARCVQGVLNMCAKCVQDVCKMYAYVMFDIIKPHAFRKYSKCWVLEKSEEICTCMRCQCNSCKSIAWFCSTYTTYRTLNESELLKFIGRIAPNLKHLEKRPAGSILDHDEH